MERVSFDEAYVRRLTDCDPEVVRHFTAYFGELILITVRARTSSREFISDIRQETFLRVFMTLRSRGGLHKPESLGAFVYAILTKVLAEFRRREVHDPPAREAFQVTDDGADPLAELVNRDRKRLVESVLAELSNTDRRILRMVYLDDGAQSQVCQRLGVTPEYFRVMLQRARDRFRKCYLEHNRLGPISSGDSIK